MTAKSDHQHSPSHVVDAAGEPIQVGGVCGLYIDLQPEDSAEPCGFFDQCSPCRCGDEVRAALTRSQRETREPRVPDSARQPSNRDTRRTT